MNLHAKSQLSSFYGFRDFSVHRHLVTTECSPKLAILAFPTSISFGYYTISRSSFHFTSLDCTSYLVGFFRCLPFAVSYKRLRWFLVLCILNAFCKRLCLSADQKRLCRGCWPAKILYETREVARGGVASKVNMRQWPRRCRRFWPTTMMAKRQILIRSHLR